MNPFTEANTVEAHTIQEANSFLDGKGDSHAQT